MKRVLLTAGVLYGICLAAQQPINPGPSVSNVPTLDKNKIAAAHPNGDRNTSWWLNYGLAVDSIFGGIAELNANYLFPDSTVLGEFGTGNFAPVWIHSIAQTMDPTSYYFQQAANCTMTDADGYSVDSMGVWYVYERNIQNTGIVDTLLVKLTHNGTATNFLSSGFIGTTASNYGTDTVGFKIPKYSYTTNQASGTTNTTFVKVPLYDTDTSVTFWGYKQFAVGNFVVPAGNVVGASISFIPGYTYAFGDTLETELNNFLFGSYEEQGGGSSGGTFPTYQDCNYQSALCDFNVSGIVRSDERYNVVGNSWNGNYIPTYAFTQPYSLEHHLWDWLITTPPTSVEEVGQSGIGLGQNMPNPANGTTTIQYSTITGGDVSFEISDLSGKVVYTSNEGQKAPGDYSLTVNTENLNAGVYFYSLTIDGVKVTRKMVISE